MNTPPIDMAIVYMIWKYPITWYAQLSERLVYFSRNSQFSALFNYCRHNLFVFTLLYCVQCSVDKIKKNMKKRIWGFATFFAVLPLFTNSDGSVQIWCWIKEDTTPGEVYTSNHTHTPFCAMRRKRVFTWDHKCNCLLTI